MAKFIYGSICLSDIPKSQIKAVKHKDGTVKKYLNIKVVERKETGQFGHTHFISCSPKKEEQIKGENYIIGDAKIYVPQEYERPSFEDINNAPIATDDSELPF